MRIGIKTEGIRFRAGGPAKPKQDYRDKNKQAVTPDGRPIWVVRLTAFDTRTEHGSSEGIWVEVAGDEPKLTTDELVQIDGLVFARTTFDSSMRYRSAVVHGVAEVVPDDEKEHALEVLSDHLFAGRTAEVRRPSRKELAATLVLRLRLDSASVKVAAGPPEVDPDDVEPRTVWAGIVPTAFVAGEPVAAPDVPDDVEVPASVHRTVRRFSR